MNSQKDLETIEAIIDRTSIQTVLNYLSDICAEKAGHLVVNWQDQTGRIAWKRAAALIGKTATNPKINTVS